LEKEEVAAHEALGIDPTNAKRGNGCVHCYQLGYKGRRGVFSFLDMNEELAKAIRHNAGEDKIINIAKEYDFQTLHDSALPLIAEGATSLEEVERVLGAYPAEFQKAKSKTPGTKTAQRGRHRRRARKGQPAARASKLEKRKLLVVEDDEAICEFLKIIFEREMFEVSQARDGIEGLHKAYECVPDVIIADVMMPEMNGIDMVQKLRGDARTRDIPILMFTANADEENELRSLVTGANDFVCKGTKPEIIVARVNHLLK